MAERNPRLKELPGLKYSTYGSKQGQDGFAVADALALKGSRVVTDTIELDENSLEILPADDERIYFRIQNIGSRLCYLQFGGENAAQGKGWKLATDEDKKLPSD